MTCTWKPSRGAPDPTLSATSQSLPFTSTHESVADMPVPEKRFPRSTPPRVPSLMSTDSAVVAAMSLPSMMLRSDRSGPQPV